MTRALRGSGWYYIIPAWARASVRYASAVAFRFEYLGARCVRAFRRSV